MKSTWIPLDLHKALRLLAVEKDSNIQALTEIAIREYLARQGRDTPAKPAPALVS